MSSAGHRENVLNRGYADVGAAVETNSKGERYWVQVFGSPLR